MTTITLIKNIEDVFVACGYPRERVRRHMEETYQRNDRDQDKEESRGTVTIISKKMCPNDSNGSPVDTLSE